jgi:hypothetical protein
MHVAVRAAVQIQRPDKHVPGWRSSKRSTQYEPRERGTPGATEDNRDRYITDAELAAVRAAALVGSHGKPTPSGAAIVARLTTQLLVDPHASNWCDVGPERSCSSSEDGDHFCHSDAG